MQRAAVTEQLSAYASAWRDAPHGRKGAVMDEAIQALGMSRATLHRHFQELVMTPIRKRRSDAGSSSLTRDEALTISAVLIEHMRKSGKRIKSVEQALNELRACNMVSASRTHPETGEVTPLSVSTVQRALRAHKLHPDQLLRPAPATSMRSLHPNHIWQIDASRCVLYYLPRRSNDNGLRVQAEDEFYKNKPDNIVKAIKDAIWRYVVTDHTSGSVFVTYVIGGETAGNLITAAIEAMVQRDGEVMHGVPTAVMLDPGSANTSAAFRNLCAALQVRVIVNSKGNPRAKGQVEKSQDLVERGFESMLKTLAPERVRHLEQINALAAKWRRHFNGTHIHSRHGMTRDQAWLHITPSQLIVAPSADVMRDLSISAPESRVVSTHLTVSFLGSDYDVSAVPGVMVGEKLMICRNPMRPGTAQAIGVDAQGHEVFHVLPQLQRDAFGQVADAPVIGEGYARHADTPAQTARQEIELLATGTASAAEAEAARKARATPFGGRYDPLAYVEATPVPAAMPRRGTEHSLVAPRVELPPLTHIQASKAMREAFPEWTPAHYAWLQAQYPAGVPADSLEAVTAELRQAMTPEAAHTQRPKLFKVA
ncbi:Phage transposase [plant metagenome]|uniref:Phage transposase n=1 Tax=plant metagenome TaxID=1297885 RepID=A0A484T5G8_9ZZZZ